MRQGVYLVAGTLVFLLIYIVRDVASVPGGGPETSFHKIEEALGTAKTVEAPVEEGEYDFFATLGRFALTLMGKRPEDSAEDAPAPAGADAAETETAALETETSAPKEEIPAAPPGDVDAQIAVAVATVKATTPKKLDQYTTLVNASASGRDVTYHFELKVSSNWLDKKTFKKKMQPQLERRVCRSNEMKQLRDLGVTFTFAYSDKKRRPIHRFKIDPERHCTA